ncbi:MAG: alpha-E domain-containing protein [Anaerolineae bacterium]|nr:alpha-E domain-containing protein [Thermoflexales bacterium]MDW8406931.1 alpha-E domain-containing protein [Anaerolineae bacterium]
MLSRVAESLYWMSRYIERAEDITRILTVNFHALLDTRLEDLKRGWQPLIEITGDQALFAQHYPEYTAQTVSEFLLWHPANPNAVIACITRARENARSVREQISSEMWEHINRLYFLVRGVNRAGVLRGPHEFFSQVRDGSQAFQGVTDATMPHGEAWQFIQLGKFLERAEKTCRILDVKYATLNTLREGTPEASLQLIAMLKSCSAFEAFRKESALQLQAGPVAHYLLLSPIFPRAVLFCLKRCQHAATAISSATLGENSRPDGAAALSLRTLGRTCSELEYLDIEDVLDARMHPFLTHLLRQINQIGDEITRAYFNAQIIQPSPRRQQAQQQQ